MAPLVSRASSSLNSLKSSNPSFRTNLLTDATLTPPALANSCTDRCGARSGFCSMKWATLRSAAGREEYIDRIFTRTPGTLTSYGI
jgi:hypothetical protein